MSTHSAPPRWVLRRRIIVGSRELPLRGAARLTEALAELAGRPLPELCDLLVQRMLDHRLDDDVALVAVRLHRQDRPLPASAGRVDVLERVPPDPAA